MKKFSSCNSEKEKPISFILRIINYYKNKLIIYTIATN